MNLKNIIVLILFTFCLTAWGQKTKKKTETIATGTAEYHVLKSDKKVKHGEYKEIGYWPQVTYISGNYSYGKRDGLWTEWYYGGQTLKCQGFYKLGKRVGIWNFYDKYKKAIIQKYNYDTKTLTMSKACHSEDIYKVYIDSNLVETKLDCPPSYIGGKNLLIESLVQKFKFSLNENKKSKRVNLEIKDIATILIKKDGTIG